MPQIPEGKKLIYYNSEFNDEIKPHVISDLELCCDRYLPNIGGMVEKSLGV